MGRPRWLARSSISTGQVVRAHSEDARVHRRRFCRKTVSAGHSSERACEFNAYVKRHTEVAKLFNRALEGWMLACGMKREDNWVPIDKVVGGAGLGCRAESNLKRYWQGHAEVRTDREQTAREVGSAFCETNPLSAYVSVCTSFERCVRALGPTRSGPDVVHPAVAYASRRGPGGSKTCG